MYMYRCYSVFTFMGNFHFSFVSFMNNSVAAFPFYDYRKDVFPVLQDQQLFCHEIHVIVLKNCKQTLRALCSTM